MTSSAGPALFANRVPAPASLRCHSSLWGFPWPRSAVRSAAMETNSKGVSASVTVRREKQDFPETRSGRGRPRRRRQGHLRCPVTNELRHTIVSTHAEHRFNKLSRDTRHSSHKTLTAHRNTRARGQQRYQRSVSASTSRALNQNVFQCVNQCQENCCLAGTWPLLIELSTWPAWLSP